jgi:hypothetical protein
MINFNFFEPKEKMPDHGDEIVFLTKINSFDIEFFDVRSGKVEFTWSEVDLDGTHRGNSICYEGPDEELENDWNYRLDVIVVDHDGGHYFKDYVYGWRRIGK